MAETDEVTEKIKVVIKTQTRNEEFQFDEHATVGEIKPEIAQRFDTDTSQLYLIYAGRQLVDAKTLLEQNVKNGFAIHLVIRQQRPNAEQHPPPTGGQQQQHHYPAPHPQRSPTMTPPLDSTINQLTATILSNPEFFQLLMNIDPRLRTYLEENPEVAHVINNPSLMREYLQIASNPNMMQEFIRSQDLSMRNIESMPGGFAALQNIYNNLSMLETPPAPTSGGGGGGGNQSPNTTPINQSQINSNPLPNPWSNTNNTTTTTPATGNAPHQPANANDFQPPPEILNEILNNPQIQQLMLQMANDPNFLRVIVNNNSNLGDEAMRNYLTSNLPLVMENLQAGGINILPTHDEMRMLYNNNSNTTTTNPAGAGTETSPPEQRFRRQLEQLNAMGFNNQQANLEALVNSRGDLNAAIDILTNLTTTNTAGQ